MAKPNITKRQIFMAIFAVIVAVLGMEIYKFNKMYDRASDAPAFQTIGFPAAPIHIVEFVDYNCPYCRISYPKILEAISQRQDIYYIARPLGVVNAASKQLAAVTLAAGLQGKFWQMHEEFLRHQGPINETAIANLGRKHGLDLQKLVQDAESEEVQEFLALNHEAANVLGVRYTPTLLINKTVYVPTGENLTAADITKAIDQAR